MVDAYEVGCGESAHAMTGCIFATRAAMAMNDGNLDYARSEATRALRYSQAWGQFGRTVVRLSENMQSTD